MHHQLEKHYVNRVGWLRAAVLGANDGLLSTTSIVIGIAAATPDKSKIHHPQADFHLQNYLVFEK